MSEVASTIHIEAPIERVWELYDDVEKLRSWGPSIVDASIAEGGTRKYVGAHLRIRFRAMGRTMELEEEVVRHEPPRGVSLKGSQMGLDYVASLDLLEEAGGTRAYYRVATEYRGWISLFRGYLDKVNRDLAEKSLLALKQAAETLGETGS